MDEPKRTTAGNHRQLATSYEPFCTHHIHRHRQTDTRTNISSKALPFSPSFQFCPSVCLCVFVCLRIYLSLRVCVCCSQSSKIFAIVVPLFFFDVVVFILSFLHSSYPSCSPSFIPSLPFLSLSTLFSLTSSFPFHAPPHSLFSCLSAAFNPALVLIVFLLQYQTFLFVFCTRCRHVPCICICKISTTVNAVSFSIKDYLYMFVEPIFCTYIQVIYIAFILKRLSTSVVYIDV